MKNFRAGLQTKITNYSKAEDGTITGFVLVLFLIMVLASGMAIDFMRHETEREAFQDTLDRAVLAAASFEQLNDPADVVNSYLMASSYDPNEIALNISYDITLNTREVSIAALYPVNTFFLRLIGIDSLNVAGRATAKTLRRDLEVQLVLDVSGSMRGDKLAALKVAAAEFIDLMFIPGEEADWPHTTVSLIPFTGQVAVPRYMADQYNLARWHDYSSCFAFEDSDFNTISISQATPFEHVEHWRTSWMSNDSAWCPRTANEILPYSMNPVALKLAIAGMEVEVNTATWQGMKWAAALIDPDSQPVIQGMITSGNIDNGYIGTRPAAWDHESGYKVIILMTDGANTTSYRVKPSAYDVMDPSWRNVANADYWETHDMPWSGTHLLTSGASVVNGSEGDVRLQDICDALKDQTEHKAAQIFTIGFDVAEDSNPYTQMKTCASRDVDFFHAEDAEELFLAFQMIAGTMKRLSLSQ